MAYHHDGDMAEFDQTLFNFEQAAASQQAQRGKTMVSPQFTAPGPDSYVPQQSQQGFQPPSHQYELFPQQTSLAPGAYSVQRRQLPSQNYNLGADVPLFDISEVEGSSYGGMEMDMFDATSMNGYLEHGSITAGSDAGDASPVAQPVQRLWPGSHSQHAAAKEQQKKLEQQRLQEQQRKAIAQQELGSAGHQRRTSQGRNKPSDPAVEERISQILRTMRQNNARNESSSASQPVMTQPARQRKDEDDMDEDERLLASEEGKKLSSKERRQLRNKVSARAFRSRRKEYITQLEGELNGKTQEADELRFDNEQLRTENAQLTDLARMLLSHPAFNTVLEDLSARGSSVALLASQNTQQLPTVQQNSQPAVPAPMPQQTTMSMDFSTPMDGWNTGIDAPDFNFNPSIFAVTELPEPVINTDTLSGKGIVDSFVSDLPSLSEKKDYPEIDRPMPKTDRPVLTSSSATDSDDLYAEPTSSISSTITTATAVKLARELTTGKEGVPYVELISIEHAEDEETALMARFECLCARLDATSSRIDQITSRC